MVKHPGYPTPSHLIPMLYWGDHAGERPHDFVDRSVLGWRRSAVALALKNGADAHPGVQAMGWADCRICGARLGSMDLTRFGFVWPEGAEHYITRHAVWTSECEDLLRAFLA